MQTREWCHFVYPPLSFLPLGSEVLEEAVALTCAGSRSQAGATSLWGISYIGKAITWPADFPQIWPFTRFVRAFYMWARLRGAHLRSDSIWGYSA